MLSGVFPALGVLLTVARHRRLDAIGALVLLGILVGTVLGLASGNARLVLIEGSAGTALAISKIMPYVVAGLLVAWMIVYVGPPGARASGSRQQIGLRRGARRPLLRCEHRG